MFSLSTLKIKSFFSPPDRVLRHISARYAYTVNVKLCLCVRWGRLGERIGVRLGERNGVQAAGVEASKNCDEFGRLSPAQGRAQASRLPALNWIGLVGTVLDLTPSLPVRHAVEST